MEIENFKEQIEKLANNEVTNEYEHGFHSAMVCVLNMLDEIEPDSRYEKLKQKIASINSEYHAYYINTDYWRGVKYVLDVLRSVDEEV